MTLSTASIFTHFQDLKAPRVERNTRHRFDNILFMALCGVICGADNWVMIQIVPIVNIIRYCWLCDNHCQTDIAEQIIEQEGDYVLSLNAIALNTQPDHRSLIRINNKNSINKHLI